MVCFFYNSFKSMILKGERAEYFFSDFGSSGIYFNLRLISMKLE